jgi:hypothetical protein
VDNYLLQPSIKSLGHSGCKVELIRQDGYKILKRSAQPSYNPRLLAQINKQKHFTDVYLRAPEVFDVREEEGLVVAEMEYINAADFVCYIEVKPIDEILWLIDRLCIHLLARIDSYQCAAPPTSVIADKLESVAKATKENQLTTHLTHLIPEPTSLTPMPLGPCHGDLTFSNMLITRDGEIYVIDLLDSFVESPLIDIVKLRQDTHHYWSIRRSRNDFDRTKTEIVFDRFDRAICEAFRGFDWWSNYSFFQRLNLCRILPYVSAPDDAKFLEIEINRV